MHLSELCNTIHKNQMRAGEKEMDTSEIKEYLSNTLCRICAEKCSKLFPILDIKLLPLKICKCLPIEVSEGDDLPLNICEGCLLKIDRSYMLYETCYFADQRLKKIWLSLMKRTGYESDISLHENDNQNNMIITQNYATSSTSTMIPASQKQVIDNNKEVPINVILVNDSTGFCQTFKDGELQCSNKPHALISSDIIISMTDENLYNNLDFLNKETGIEFVNNTALLQENENLITALPKSIDDNIVEEEGFNIENSNVKREISENAKENSFNVHKYRFSKQQMSSQNSLVAHESSHSQEKPYLCDICGKSYKHVNNLKSHRKIHSAQRKKYTCKICNKSFFTNFFLQEHMNIHTGETPYKCQVCAKEFREKVHLRQHKWTHSSEKFLCPVCGNHFNRKGNMTEHIKKYHSSNEKEKKTQKKSEIKKAGDVKYPCQVCEKSFSSQIVLKNHHKRHATIKELHFCSLCGKQFRYSGSLTYHRRTAHTGEKPFQCSYCDERFSLRSVQRIHERKKHTFEYPYKCSFCPRHFNNSSSLKNHSYVHLKEKMFDCNICGKKFSRNSNLYVHKKIHTDDRRYTCEHCGKSYIQKHDMIKHKKVHDPKSKPFFCKYCGNSFAHKKDVARHAFCHVDYIRKSNSDMGSAEKILETVTGDLEKNSKTLFEMERLILESSQELADSVHETDTT